MRRIVGKSYFQKSKKSRWSELNRRPATYKVAALPLSYTGVISAVVSLSRQNEQNRCSTTELH